MIKLKEKNIKEMELYLKEAFSLNKEKIRIIRDLFICDITDMESLLYIVNLFLKKDINVYIDFFENQYYIGVLYEKNEK